MNDEGTKTNRARLEKSARQAISRGEIATGLEFINQLIAQEAATSEIWKLAGVGLARVREYAQVIDVLQQALKLAPRDIEARFNLAAALYQLGKVSESVRLFAALRDEGHQINADCNLATIVPGCPNTSPAEIRVIRQQFARRLQAAEAGQLPPLGDARQAGHPLRLGFVSAFFGSENYMKPVWILLNQISRKDFQVHLFDDNGTRHRRDWFERRRGDQVHQTQHLNNRQLAQAIRDAEIDMVIDLNGYSVPGRLPLYTYTLAPVTLAWFNLYATSGLPGIDWIIGDRCVARPGDDEYFTERIYRLPCSYLTFHVSYAAPEVMPPPCLTDPRITFGSLVSQYKITPQVFDAWATILRRVPASRFVMANRAMQSQSNRDSVMNEWTGRGIDSSRIEILPPAEHAEFLKYYARIDLALDAFPYNGGTTTTEAIWQGVPVFALDGDRWAARTSVTLLKHAGLSAFVGRDTDEFIERAVGWANDPQTPAKLASLRRSMRSMLSESSVCDHRQMTAEMESALRFIWDRRAEDGPNA